MVNVCSMASYERHITKVVIEIANPTAVEIVQDIKVTFPDMLGTVGNRHRRRIINTGRI